jgi:signal transduction histidine kinase
MEKSLADALDLGRKEGLAPLELRPVRPGETARALVELFSPAARASGVRLEHDLDRDASVTADPELMRRIIANLLSNGLKYTATGGRVTVSVKAKDNGVLVSVEDTGPGISPENKELIFDKFYRAPQADKSRSRIPGTGLGLAIAKSATERLGGKIWVESELGKGSIFNVFFYNSKNRESVS